MANTVFNFKNGYEEIKVSACASTSAIGAQLHAVKL